MKLLIIGATGPTGQELVRQAVNRGFSVTALVRNPAKLAIKSENISVLTADILNEEELTQAVMNRDAVLSALGSGKDLHSNIISSFMPVLIQSMHRAQVKRVIFISSFGVGETRKQAPFFGRILFKLLLNHILEDKTKADELLKNSDLDYTLVYPTSLTNGALTGKYQAGEQVDLPAFPRISRADVADFMLNQLTETKWIRRTSILSN